VLLVLLAIVSHLLKFATDPPIGYLGTVSQIEAITELAD
jgi:hypothetical protein